MKQSVWWSWLTLTLLLTLACSILPWKGDVSQNIGTAIAVFSEPEEELVKDVIIVTPLVILTPTPTPIPILTITPTITPTVTPPFPVVVLPGENPPPPPPDVPPDSPTDTFSTPIPLTPTPAPLPTSTPSLPFPLVTPSPTASTTPATPTPALTSSPLPATPTPEGENGEGDDTPKPTHTPEPTRLPLLAFSAANFSAIEASGMVAIMVVLDAPFSQIVTVNYATSDGSATAGSDYTANSNILTFSPGQTSQTFSVPIINDILANEFDETINLSLSNPVNAGLDTPNSAILSLADDEPQPIVQFSSSSYGVDEISGATSITITLNLASALPITVSYATADNTATAGKDYAAVSGNLAFPPLQTSSLAFAVPLSDDLVLEGDETIELNLSNSVNAVLGPPNPATLTIVNTDTLGLYVSSWNTSKVLRYDAQSGAFQGVFTSGSSATGANDLVFGPDGNLYVSFDSSVVERYDGSTGILIDQFVPSLTDNNPGKFLVKGTGLRFGPDGDLYVSSGASTEIKHYDGITGNFINSFGTTAVLTGPRGLILGPGNNFYVSSAESDEVFRFDSTSTVVSGSCGTPSVAFICAGSGGLDAPEGLIFGSDGNLYVSSAYTNQVLRYDTTTGLLNVFASGGSLTDPHGLVFGSDGNLYVSSFGSDEVLRYRSDGTFMDVFVSAGAGGLDGPAYLMFGP